MSNKIYPSIKFVIEGEPASKANSRKIVKFGKKFGVIKSEKARNYVKSFQEQCPKLEKLIELDVIVEIKIYYQSRRPDLDESVILDCMQGFIYANDRQVKQKHIYWGLDREQPRTHIRVTPMEASRMPSDF